MDGLNVLGPELLHMYSKAALLVDLLGFLLHRRRGSPLQIFAALPECQVLTLEASQQNRKTLLETLLNVEI